MRFKVINIILLTFLSLSTLVYADPDASFFNGYPIYSCDTTQSSCLLTVSNKADSIVRQGGNPYYYAYAVNIQTAGLSKYRNTVIFEGSDKLVLTTLVATDSQANSKWAGVEESFTGLINAIPYNLDINQISFLSNETSPLTLIAIRKLTQFLVTSAFAQTENNCPNTEFDGTIETASASDFVASSALRQEAFNNLSSLQTALASLVGAFDALVGLGDITIGYGSSSFSIGSFTPPTLINGTFFDGSRVGLRVDLNAMTFSTDNSTIVDCNGNSYEEDREPDVGSTYNFDSERSFQDFMIYHNQSSTSLGNLPQHAYFHCWTPTPGTVKCEKRYR